MAKFSTSADCGRPAVGPRSLKPLYFRSEKNINCITNACKRSGFKRLIKGQSFNLYWGRHLNEKALRALNPHQARSAQSQSESGA